MTEAAIQDLIHRFPSCLPIAEIDPLFANPVPICRELSTPAGPIDNFMVTPTGLPVLAECKLWRNPEGRREVVGQILDYPAKQQPRLWRRQARAAIPSAKLPIPQLRDGCSLTAADRASARDPPHLGPPSGLLSLIPGTAVARPVKRWRAQSARAGVVRFAVSIGEAMASQMPDAVSAPKLP
ncbi:MULTISPECIES: hypothetical protein [unclassified Mesorhizobium]|uniref:hypothetical protein n=1 Tax=unclassified Mesorhizobium TaxID=325217 RepID=UPI0019D498F4|nr:MULTISPECIES: hypothetical protein [unclassified Mesorhizobium]